MNNDFFDVLDNNKEHLSDMAMAAEVAAENGYSAWERSDENVAAEDAQCECVNNGDYCDACAQHIARQTGAREGDSNHFSVASVKRILRAYDVKLENFHTVKGYYIYLDDKLFCSVADPGKLGHLFDILRKKVQL